MILFRNFCINFFSFWSWSKNIMSKFVLPLWPTFMVSMNGHESWWQAYSMFYIRRKNSVKTTILMLFFNLMNLNFIPPPLKKKLAHKCNTFWWQNVAKALPSISPFPFSISRKFHRWIWWPTDPVYSKANNIKICQIRVVVSEYRHGISSC